MKYLGRGEHSVNQLEEMIEILREREIKLQSRVAELEEALNKLLSTVPYNTIKPDYLIEAEKALSGSKHE